MLQPSESALERLLDYFHLNVRLACFMTASSQLTKLMETMTHPSVEKIKQRQHA
jgi:hypothetical protein